MDRHNSASKSKVTFKVNGASNVVNESPVRYRALFDLAPVAVYSCDASGVIQEYNTRAAQLWGRKPQPGDTDERFCGSFKMYRPDGSFMPHEQCPMGDVLSGQIPEIHDAEVHIQRPDGSRIIVLVNIAPLTDDRGSIIGAINCFYDVTESKRTETRTQDRLRALAAELNVTEQRERQRLAAELHDNLGQLLAFSRIKLSQARQQPLPALAAKIIAEVDQVIDKASTYTRTLVSQLCPLALHESGLPMALQWLTEQMREQNLIVLLQVKTKIPMLPKDQALLLFQTVRELLINCVKHANTHNATLTLEWIHGSLYIQVSDQGMGFDPLASASKKEHSPARGFGLLSIRERLVSLGGRFELESSPGKGTTATLVLPLGDSIGESSFIPSEGPTTAEAKVPRQRGAL